MTRVLAAVLALLVLASTADAQARLPRRFRLGHVAVAGSPIAANTHPRLLFTTSTLTDIQTRLCTTTEVKAQFVQFAKDVETLWVGGGSSSQSAQSEDAAMMAFIYNVYDAVNACGIWTSVGTHHTKAEYFAQAKYYLDNGVILNPTWTSDRVIAFPHMLAFDWLYNDLTSGERTTYATWLSNWVPTYAFDGPWSSVYGGAVIGTRLLAALAVKGMGGAYDTFADATIAGYDADFRNASTGNVYAQSFAVGCLVGVACSTANSTFGGSTEGELYWDAVGPFGTIHHMLFAEEAYRTAYGLSRSTFYADAALNVFRYFPRFIADLNDSYTTPNLYLGVGALGTPSTYTQFFKKGPASSAAQFYESHGQFYSLATIACAYKDVDATQAGVAQWILTNWIGRPYYTYGMLDWMAQFATGCDGVTPVDPTATFPLTVARGDGEWIFRTGWQSTANNQARVDIEIPKWMTDPAGTYNFMNGFEISRKGKQVLRMGYFGHDGGGGRSCCSNFMVFPDVTDQTTAPCTVNSPPCTLGGHRMGEGSGPTGASDLVDNSVWDMRGTVYQSLSTVTGWDVEYVAADITKAYSTRTQAEGGPTGAFGHSSGEESHVNSYWREFINFTPVTPNTDPVWLVVLDRVTTPNTKFEKRWLLHPATEPTVTGSSTTGPSRGPTTTDGRTMYTSVTNVTWTNTTSSFGATMNGQGWLHTLMPASFKVLKTGGPNTTQSGDGNGGRWRGTNTSGGASSAFSHEFEDPYGGQGYLAGIPTSAEAPFVGSFTLEVQPVTPALQDTFCQVVAVGDNGSTKATVTDGSTATMCAATIEGTSYNRAFALGKTANLLTTGSAILAKAGTYKFLVCSLAISTSFTFNPGANISLQAQGNDNNYTVSSNAGGCVYMDNVVVTGSASDAAHTIAF